MEINFTFPTIAIVDDDKTFRYVFSVQILEIDNNIKTLQFEDGFDILEFLLVHKEEPQRLPDIIFLDIAMKDIDGWVFLEEFESIKKYLPKPVYIYIITASNEAEDKLKAASNSNVFELLAKPLDSKKLKKIISKELKSLS